MGGPIVAVSQLGFVTAVNGQQRATGSNAPVRREPTQASGPFPAPKTLPRIFHPSFSFFPEKHTLESIPVQRPEGPKADKFAGPGDCGLQIRAEDPICPSKGHVLPQ